MTKKLIIAGLIIGLVTWISVSSYWLSNLSAQPDPRPKTSDQTRTPKTIDQYFIERPEIADDGSRKKNNIPVLSISNHENYSLRITAYNAKTDYKSFKVFDLLDDKVGIGLEENFFLIKGAKTNAQFKVDLPSKYSMEPDSARGPVDSRTVLRYFFYHGLPFSKTSSFGVTGAFTTSELIEKCKEKKISGAFFDIVKRPGVE